MNEKELGTKLLRNMAKAGNVEACIELARRYETGTALLQKDLALALYWIWKAVQIVAKKDKDVIAPNNLDEETYLGILKELKEEDAKMTPREIKLCELIDLFGRSLGFHKSLSEGLMKRKRTKEEEQNLKSLWGRCLKIIRDKISPEQFATSFAFVEIYSFDNGKLILDVPNEFVKNDLEQNYLKLMVSTFKRVFGNRVKGLYYNLPEREHR